MKILITGGAGFIGSNFIRYLLKNYKNYKIINLDKLTYAGNLENLKDIENNPNYKFIKGDICEEGLVNDLMKEVEYVINFAAETHVDRSIKASSDFILTNILGTRVLLDVALKYKIKKFIQIGTDEVYGSLDENSLSSKETDHLKPRSPYSASKAAADLLALSYFETHKLPICITRSSNNYGPYQYPEKVIPLFITNLLEGKKVPLYGTGNNIRDWIHVEDNCNAIALILEKGKPGEIYNIGGGNELKNINLTKLILSKMEFDEKMIQYVEDRKGHDLRYSLDSTKIKKELDWKPLKLLDTGIKNTIEWYKDNEEWWSPLKK